jgi:hypothetical protein
LKIKLNGRHFDTIEVIEAEYQAVLHTLTEYNFQDESFRLVMVEGMEARIRLLWT